MTIAIPVYNGSNFLAEAIDSALAQTYDDVEVIVVNDGSTDSGATAAVARRYEERITYIEQPNGGVGSAMNTALAHMKGDVFTWLSHDDIHLPEKVAAQVAYYNRIGKSDAILFSNAHLMNEAGEVWDTSDWPYEEFVKAPMLALMNGHINGCTLFIPAHILREVGPFDVTLRFTQDYDLWNRILSRHEFFFQPCPLVKYRVHPGQDSKNPGAVAEGDLLWTRIVDSRSEIERVQLFGSSQRFFDEMAAFLGKTPYKHAAAYAAARRESVSQELCVSVVIPFFNDVPRLLRAIRSVQCQTRQHLEIIVVDDGSTEDTSAVSTAARSDPRVKLVRQENAGAGAARNHGLSLASGAYIAFLDADDLFLPYKVQSQLDLMQEHGAVVSHTSYHVIFPERHGRLGTVWSGAASGRIYPAVLGRCPIATPTVMLHRSVVNEGFQFPTETLVGEDVLSWIWISQRHEVLGIEKPMTVVEWSTTSAALNVRKCLQGISYIYRTLKADMLHSRFQELEQLEAAMRYLERACAREPALDQRHELNEELIQSVFHLEC